MSVWRDLWTPGGNSTPHHRAVTAGGHALLGASVVAWFDAWGLGAGILLAVVYWAIKETADLRNGGSVWDGLEDTAMVGLGAWYGAAWWPALIVVAMGYIMWQAGRK